MWVPPQSKFHHLEKKTWLKWGPILLEFIQILWQDDKPSSILPEMDGIQFEIVYLGLHEFTTIWGTMGTSSTRYEMPTVELWGLWPALITCINPNYCTCLGETTGKELFFIRFWSHFPWTATPTHIPADEWPKGIGIGGIRGLLPAALFIGVGGGAVAVAAPPGNICEGCSLGAIGHRPWEGHKSQIN